MLLLIDDWAWEAYRRGEVPTGKKRKREDRPVGVCYEFQEGRCTRGENCKFRHVEGGAQAE